MIFTGNHVPLDTHILLPFVWRISHAMIVKDYFQRLKKKQYCVRSDVVFAQQISSNEQCSPLTLKKLYVNIVQNIIITLYILYVIQLLSRVYNVTLYTQINVF
jgi:hypothetical protein